MHDPQPGPTPSPQVAALLDGLTPEQQTAVWHWTGPLLVFAGPGAGKTNTLTRRIARLLADGVPASQILAVTFTVAAAGEMRLRLMHLLGEEAVRGLTVCTFHSVCVRILRDHSAACGRGEAFTIYDQAEVKKIINHVSSDADRAAIQQQVQRFGDPPADVVLKEISLAKNRLWDPAFYEAHSQHPIAPLIAAIWREVDLELQQSNAFDFDDLLVYAARLLASSQAIGDSYRARWRWLLVDEFQDTNYAQLALVQLLAGQAGNLTVVADDDQCLYKFRGAEPDNVLRFTESFPTACSVTLGRNFRSHSEIVELAGRSIEHNTRRVHKQFVAHRGPGGTVECWSFPTDVGEAEWIASQISEALAAGVGYEDVMAIAGTNFATNRLQHTLASYGIPHRVLGALGLFERKEVKDAMAYLQLLANPQDAQAFRRAISSPRRGVGAATANRIIEAARAGDGDLVAACVNLPNIGKVPKATKENIALFGQELVRLRLEQQAGRSVGHIVTGAVTMAGGIVRYHQDLRDGEQTSNADRRDAERVLEDLRSLCRAANHHDESDPQPSLTGFLEQAALTTTVDVDGPDERITISTIHKAKGTEASLVFVLGCEEGLLPSGKALEEGDEMTIEEQRRLFYVAATRAKDRLVLTMAQTRNDRQTDGPSRFLREAGAF